LNRTFAFLRQESIRRTAGYYLLFLCLGLDAAVLGPNLPVMAEQTGARLGEMGALFLFGALGAVFGTVVGGRVFDRMRGHPVLGMAQLAVAGITFCVPFAPSLWILLALLLLKGVAGGMIGTGANTLLVWTHREKVGPYMNGLHFCFGLGAFLAPFLVAQVVGAEGGYRLAFWIIAAADALAGVRLLALSPSPTPAVYNAEKPGAEPVPSRQYALILAAALFLFFYVGAEISFGGWIASYAVTQHLADAVGAAYLTSAFWLAFTVGRLIAIPSAARFTPRQILPAALAACLAALCLPLALPGSAAALWIAAAGLGFSMAPIWPTGFTFAGQSLRLTARTTSFVLLGDTFGGMILPWLTGFILDRTGPAAVLFLVLASLLATLLAFIGILRLRPVSRAGA
jgi:FHS family Na+ dependent glucose MFS transporter 1